jgi:hypothetical protein
METAAPTPSDQTLQNLCDRLKAAAVEVGLAGAEAPELAGQVFLGGDGAESTRLRPSDLPHPVRALKIGRYSIVVTMLPEQPSVEAVTEALRRFRNQCVVARSFLSANEALDLQGVLVGPRGSESADEWTPLALLVERDERVARKFAWLRPAGGKADDGKAEDASFRDLIKRTFLARPWINESTFTMAALDNLNRAAAMWDTTVSRDTVDEWVKLSLEPRDDPDTLVQALVDTWSRRGQL